MNLPSIDFFFFHSSVCYWQLVLADSLRGSSMDPIPAAHIDIDPTKEGNSIQEPSSRIS